MKRLAAALALTAFTMMSITGCSSDKEKKLEAQVELLQQQLASSQQLLAVAQQQAQQAQVVAAQAAQPTVQVVQGDTGLGAIGTAVSSGIGAAAGSYLGTKMANGEVFNGKNWYGPAPRGMELDQRTHSLKPRYVPLPKPAAQQASAQAAAVQTVPAKVKNPGDAAAAAEAAKMKAEGAAAQAAPVKDRNAMLAERRASLERARATAQKSNFKNSVTSRSTASSTPRPAAKSYAKK